MEEKILSGLIPLSLTDRDIVLQSKKNLLSTMSRGITFKDITSKLIYSVLVSYFKATNSFPDSDMFADILRDNQVEPDKVAKALVKFEILSQESLPQDKFEFYLNRFKDTIDKEDFENTLVEALNSLKEGDNIETGQTALSLAKEKVIPKLFDSAMLKDDTPSGDITREKDELMMEYEEAKRTGGVVGGLKTGINKIDDSIDAMVNGQLIIAAGASGEGKSWLAANIAWYNCVVAKKNVVIITAETLRTQYRRRVIVRHSNLAKFGYPLEFTKVKEGKLSEEEEEIYEMIVNDFTSGEYGSLDISQVSNGTTLSDIRIYLEKLGLQKKIDLVILDYLTLLKPTVRKASQREEAVELMKEAKNIAISYNKGQGIPLLTLHQISTQAREKAQFVPGKCYSLASLADSSEAGKSADIAFALIRTEDMIEEHELGVQILKTRDSYSDERMFKLFENYQYAYIGNLEE